MKQRFFDEQFELGGTTPAIWALNARRLKKSGDIVFNAWIEDVVNLGNGLPLSELDNLELGGCAMLLYGLSLENLAKGLLIEVNPSLISNGTVGKWPGGGNDGHNLNGLIEQAGVSLTDDEKDLLTRLTAFVRWAGRYPIPMSAKKIAVPQNHVLSPFTPLPLSAAERELFK